MTRQRKINHPSWTARAEATDNPGKFVGVPLTLIAGVMAVISTGFLTADFTDLAVTAIRMEDISTAIQLLTLYVPVYVLLYGAFSYIAMRYGHFKRVAAEPHDRDLGMIFNGDIKELLVLVPSYKEELPVIRQTLLSAALVEYPAKQVVLLVDNPFNPKSLEDQKLLNATRQLIVDLQALFDRAADRLAKELEGFLARCREDNIDRSSESK